MRQFQGLLFLAMSVSSVRSKSPIPELVLMTDTNQLMDMIKIFGGQTIRIPTVTEFQEDMHTAIAIYHVEVEGKSWDWFAEQYNIDGFKMRTIRALHRYWVDMLEKEGIDIRRYLEGAQHVTS